MILLSLIKQNSIPKNPSPFFTLTSTLYKNILIPLELLQKRIENYHYPESTPSEANKGGVLIYVNKIHNYKPRTDLHIYESKLLESSFVEIINQKRPNDIVGAIYRHPSMTVDYFNDEHLRPLITSLSKDKNKNIHLAGDFNVDLLNFSKHTSSAEFFDIMCSNHLLPSISLPTKLNNNSKTLIDNIFTNTFNPDTTSGNITFNISDGHLPSFIIIPKSNQNCELGNQ